MTLLAALCLATLCLQAPTEVSVLNPALIDEERNAYLVSLGDVAPGYEPLTLTATVEIEANRLDDSGAFVPPELRCLYRLIDGSGAVIDCAIPDGTEWQGTWVAPVELKLVSMDKDSGQSILTVAVPFGSRVQGWPTPLMADGTYTVEMLFGWVDTLAVDVGGLPVGADWSSAVTVTVAKPLLWATVSAEEVGNGEQVDVLLSSGPSVSVDRVFRLQATIPGSILLPPTVTIPANQEYGAFVIGGTTSSLQRTRLAFFAWSDTQMATELGGSNYFNVVVAPLSGWNGFELNPADNDQQQDPVPDPVSDIDSLCVLGYIQDMGDPYTLCGRCIPAPLTPQSDCRKWQIFGRETRCTFYNFLNDCCTGGEKDVAGPGYERIHITPPVACFPWSAWNWRQICCTYDKIPGRIITHTVRDCVTCD